MIRFLVSVLFSSVFLGLFSSSAQAQCGILVSSPEEIHAIELAKYYVIKREFPRALYQVAYHYSTLMEDYDPKKLELSYDAFPIDEALETVAITIIRTQGKLFFGKRPRLTSPAEREAHLKWATGMLEALNKRAKYSRLRKKRERRVAEAWSSQKIRDEEARKFFHLDTLDFMAESAVLEEAARFVARTQDDSKLVRKLEEEAKKAREREDSNVSKPSEYMGIPRKCKK